MAKREEIRDLSVQSLKKINDNMRYLWMQAYKSVDTGDLGGKLKSLVKTVQSREIGYYQTAESYIGDLGSGTVGADGKCTVAIEPKFKAYIGSQGYHVFVQIYNGSITTIDRQPDSFTVSGTAGTQFAWEIKAKRKGFETYRLDTSI